MGLRGQQRRPAVDPSAFVAPSAVIDAPLRPLLSRTRQSNTRRTVIGSGCWIGQHCVIGAGTVLGQGTVVDHGVLIEGNAEIGERVLLTHRALVAADAVIGDDCLIAGFVADGVSVGRNSRIFGSLIHRQLSPNLPWDDPVAQEPAPIVEDDAFVGWSATVVGPSTIHRFAYVAAGATVTRSVPAGHVAFGVNKVIPASEWPGALSESEFFRLTAPHGHGGDGVRTARHRRH
jgi:UDP-2-acetamido-3-amino-2,3-dideoxy-glucuronate N-acetyltransferase